MSIKIEYPGFVLSKPLPMYGADNALREVLVDYIVQTGRSAGEPFYSDRELGELVGKSRGVVRRALDALQDEGWIERRGGIGTFIGPRAEQPRAEFNCRSTDSVPVTDSPVLCKKLKHCLVVNARNDSSYSWGLRSWCTEIMDVFSALAQNSSVMIEYLNASYTDNPKLLRRLESAPPDAIFCMGPPLDHLDMMHLACQSGIPLILAGTRAPEMNVINVCENSIAAGEMAVKYLYERGHRRIGFVQNLSAMTGWWFADRYQGYLNGLKKYGLYEEYHQDLSCWLSPSSCYSTDPDNMEAIKNEFLEYFKYKAPTAVLMGCSYVAACFQNICQNRLIRIPEDLSVMVYDQSSEVRAWFGGLKPTTIVFPLNEIARTLFSYAERMINGLEVTAETRLDCIIDEGDTVQNKN